MFRSAIGMLAFVLVFTFIGCENKRERKSENIVTSPAEGDTEEHSVQFYTYTEHSDYPDAILEMYSPLGNQNFSSTKVPFEFNVKNYPFGEKGMGFQLKMILNGNDPIGYNMPIFQKELNQGTYRAVAYLVDEEGLALKEFGNYVDRDFRVMDSQPFPENDEPFMILNLPLNGQEYGEGEEVIVDFMVLDGELQSDGYKVKIKLNGYEFTTDEMEPIRVDQLPAGEYDLEVGLIKADGSDLEGVFTSARKQIKVN
ncbi:hypothetical protein [Litoribacter populi]|uniref:hypothetical protein n=1 Tax=Litoribacter populi TaxID=2598460 RepID=UPI00163D6477|nr:hypothetical protein [Litoribacter populi]